MGKQNYRFIKLVNKITGVIKIINYITDFGLINLINYIAEL